MTREQAVKLACQFHDTYERLAPSFGYATRDDTKHFDPGTPHGKLMTAVCTEVCKPMLDRIKSLESAIYHTRPDEMMFGGEGWTWKQQAKATEDRLKECESRLAELEGMP